MAKLQAPSYLQRRPTLGTRVSFFHLTHIYKITIRKVPSGVCVYVVIVWLVEGYNCVLYSVGGVVPINPYGRWDVDIEKAVEEVKRLIEEDKK